MARKSKSVAKHKIPEIASSLKAKAAVPITVSLEETISALAAPIQAMLDAGYTYADVASVFKSHGVELAASSIKSYHRKQTQSEQTNVTKQPSAVGEISSSLTQGDLPENEHSSSPGSEDKGSDWDLSEDSDGDEIAPSVDELLPSMPKQNTKTAKNSSPPPTQVNSKFNVTDRSKL